MFWHMHPGSNFFWKECFDNLKPNIQFPFYVLAMRSACYSLKKRSMGL